MKKILFFLLFIPFVSFSQEFNGFKYAYVENIIYADGEHNKYKVSEQIKNYLDSKGFIILNENEITKAGINPCEILKFTPIVNNLYGSAKVTIRYSDCTDNTAAFSKTSKSKNLDKSFFNATSIVLRYIGRDIGNHNFDSNKTPSYTISFPIYKGDDIIDFSNEGSIRKFLSKKEFDPIEGIWNYISSNNSGYKLLILKEDYNYNAYIIEGAGFWKSSEVKAVFEPTARNNFFTLIWTMGDKKTIIKTTAALDDAIIRIEKFKNPLYKVFPIIENSKKIKRIDKDDWIGNGSGVIISESGHIVTNHHVIDDAVEIEVEFIIDDEVQMFNAEIVQVNKVDDLAIIKIVDINFYGVEELPYNFKTRSSDVGTKIYTFGYPKALSGMGKEIKVTEGIISSKSGFDGDITTYQITAPIQGGNSGGPLFDDKGNFIGINSSKFNSDETENVNYSIKSSYVMSLIDVLPKSIDLPSSTKLQSLTLTEQIKEISKYVVLVKVK